MRNAAKPCHIRWFIGSVAALGAVFASAFASAADTTVTYRSWAPIIEHTQKMIEATAQEHPDIKVEARSSTIRTISSTCRPGPVAEPCPT